MIQPRPETILQQSKALLLFRLVELRVQKHIPQFSAKFQVLQHFGARC